MQFYLRGCANGLADKNVVFQPSQMIGIGFEGRCGGEVVQRGVYKRSAENLRCILGRNGADAVVFNIEAAAVIQPHAVSGRKLAFAVGTDDLTVHTAGKNRTVDGIAVKVVADQLTAGNGNQLPSAVGGILSYHNGGIDLYKNGEEFFQFFKRKIFKNAGKENRFAEGFVTACIVFCVGSMTVMGSIEAGINKDYSIIFAKSALDFVSGMAFGAAMGVGVTFSALFILVYQGALTLLAGVVGPLLSPQVVTEMNAIGGTILIGMAINMLELSKTRIKVANMLPAIFLPILYFPIYNWIAGLLG